jgi:hypothetical protein
VQHLFSLPQVIVSYMPLASSGRAAKAIYAQHRAIIDHIARFAAACAARSSIASFLRRQLRARGQN